MTKPIIQVGTAIGIMYPDGSIKDATIEPTAFGPVIVALPAVTPDVPWGKAAVLKLCRHCGLPITVVTYGANAEDWQHTNGYYGCNWGAPQCLDGLYAEPFIDAISDHYFTD